MSISYTKRGWTNNSPPAINAAHLGAMDDGLKNAIDALNNMGDAGQQAVKEIGAAPASTTGGKLVNKITEAGYSLAPATGTSNLDNIADGTSYKRIQAAKADAINGGTFDAASVVAFGIGAPEKDLGTGANLDNIQYTGFFMVQSPTTTMPSVSEIYWRIINIYESALNATQIAFSKTVSTSHVYIRKNISGTWSNWYEIWNASSDGNGGQPPAPKGVAGSFTSTANTPTTIFTFSREDKLYDFYAYVGGADIAYFTIGELIVYSGGSGGGVEYKSFHTGSQISVGISGFNVQITVPGTGWVVSWNIRKRI